MGKIEEMEKMLKEAHAEKSRLMESRVRLTGARRQQVVSIELPSAFQYLRCTTALPPKLAMQGKFVFL